MAVTRATCRHTSSAQDRQCSFPGIPTKSAILHAKHPRGYHPCPWPGGPIGTEAEKLGIMGGQLPRERPSSRTKRQTSCQDVCHLSRRRPGSTRQVAIFWAVPGANCLDPGHLGRPRCRDAKFLVIFRARLPRFWALCPVLTPKERWGGRVLATSCPRVPRFLAPARPAWPVCWHPTAPADEPTGEVPSFLSG